MAIQNVFEVSRRFELSPDDVSRCIMHLKALGLSEGTVVKVLEAFPMVVGHRMKPLLVEFEDLDFSLNVIRKEVLREPRLLALESGELSQCLKMLSSLKCRAAIRESIFSNGDFRAGYEVKLRVDLLRKYGLTYRDAFAVLCREPRAILYEIPDIKKKIEFLLHSIKFDILCLVQVPEYWGVNFEKKIMARFHVVNYLRSRGWLGDEVGLRGLIKPSRLRFFNLYVKPYPECEKILWEVCGRCRG